MVYKKHEIEIQYRPGSDFTVTKDGSVRTIKPKHVDFVRVTSPDGMRWNEISIADAKKTIDRHLAM